MQDAIIYLDPESSLNLRNQIRQKLVDGIPNGAFPPSLKLPSSRNLARQLDVARNTVVAAYQQLVADGYLVSRQRSGIFVNSEMLETRVGYSNKSSPAAKVESAAWAHRVRVMPTALREVHDQPNWRRFWPLKEDSNIHLHLLIWTHSFYLNQRIKSDFSETT